MTRNQTPVFPSLAARLSLLPLAPLYWALTVLRPLFYRWGWLRTHRARTPVVSVGNLSVGGSGKSPLVEYLAREAARLGLRPAVATRGYGRRGGSSLLRVRLDEGVAAHPEQMGDEPYLLAWRNPALPVVVGSDRVAAARLAEALDRPDVILLDDGYQHLRLARELNVLLVDAERGLGNGRLLPLGILREPASALARADVILITKAGLGDADALRKTLAGRWGARAPIFTCDYLPARLLRLDGGAELPASALAGRGSPWCAPSLSRGDSCEPLKGWGPRCGRCGPCAITTPSARANSPPWRRPWPGCRGRAAPPAENPRRKPPRKP